MTTLTAPAAPEAVRIEQDRRDNRRARRRRRLGWVADHSVGIALAIIFLSPFVFIFLQSMMTSTQALTGDLWPRTWHPENYVDVFTKAPMLTYLRNTVLYAALATVLMLVSSIPAAYALSRLQWKGRNVALVIVLMMMMLPPQVTQVPIYVMWTKLHLTGTLWPLRVMMSAPPLTSACINGTVSAGSGSPAVMKGINALRPWSCRRWKVD